MANPFALSGGLSDEIDEINNSEPSPSLMEAEKIVMDESSGVQGVERVCAIFAAEQNLDSNTKFPPYGETLLYNALTHSVAMVKLLLEIGADPSVGNMMDGETPLDALLEMEEDDRSADQQKMIALMTAQGAKKSPSIEEQIIEERDKLVRMMGEDPEEIDALPDGIFKTVYLRELGRKITLLISMTPREREEACEELRNEKAKNEIKEKYEEMPETSKALMEEAFHLLDLNEDFEKNFESSSQAVKRIKEILSSGAEGVSPNLLSPTRGESLLYIVLGVEFDKGHTLELIKFLLDAGADPNLENVGCIRETALDFIDWTVPLQEVTEEQNEIVKLLKERGAKLLPKNDDQEIIGERGDEFKGFWEQAAESTSDVAMIEQGESNKEPKTS
jgi:hypothetical protein